MQLRELYRLQQSDFEISTASQVVFVDEQKISAFHDQIKL